MLVEAAWVAVRAPGPLRAFYERVRARRGAQVAAVATARKLASLFWCLLTREQDYAFGQPSLTRQKIRQLELAAGAPSRKGQVRAGAGARTNAHPRRRTRARPPSRERLPPHDHRLEGDRTGEGGRERDTGARISKALEGQSRAADHKPLTSALRFRQSPAPTTRSPQEPPPDQPLTFIRQSCASERLEGPNPW